MTAVAISITLCAERAEAAAARVVVATNQRSLPNRPAGRNISTMTMTTKITVFDASG